MFLFVFAFLGALFVVIMAIPVAIYALLVGVAFISWVARGAEHFCCEKHED